MSEPTPIAPATRSLRARLLSGAGWSVFGTAAAQGSLLVASVIAARLLGRTAFGGLGMIQGTVGMLGILAGMGLGTTTTRYLADLRTRDRERCGRVLGLTLGIGVVLASAIATTVALFAGPLAAHWLSAPELAVPLRIGAALLLFNALAQLEIAALIGLETFRPVARVQLLGGLASLALVTAGISLGGLAGGVSGLAAASALTWLGLLRARVVACREHGIVLATGRGEGALLWHFALPAFLAGSMGVPVIWFATAQLAAQPDGYAELGLYNVGRSWWQVLLLVPMALSRSVLPILTERLAALDRRGVRRVLVAAIATNAAIGIPVAFAISLAAAPLLALYGPEFAGGETLLVIMAWTAVVLALEVPVGQLISAAGRMWTGFAMNVAWAAVLLTAFQFQKDSGAVGLATALFIAYVAHGISTLAVTLRILRDPNQSSSLLSAVSTKLAA